MTDLAKISVQLRQQVSNLDVKAVLEYFPVFADLFSNYLSAILSRQKQSLDPNTSVFLASCLDTLRIVSKMKLFQERISVHKFESPHVKISDILSIISQISCGDKDFAFTVWKRTVSIVSPFLTQETVIFWHSPIRSVFNMAPVGQKKKENDLRAQRLEHLCQFIAKRKMNTIPYWWELLSSEILIEFYEYPIINRKGQLEYHGRSNGSFNKEILLLFLKNSKIKQMIPFSIEEATGILCLVHFFIFLEYKSNQSLAEDTLHWFLTTWSQIDQKCRDSLLNLFKTYSPISIQYFAQLYAKDCVLRSDHKFDWCELNVLRQSCKDLLQPQTLFGSILAIQGEIEGAYPDLVLPMFYTMMYDFKAADKQSWSFLLKRKGILDRIENITLTKQFMEILGVALSPLFIGFTKNDIQQILNRNERLHVSDTHNLISIFDSPKYFCFTDKSESTHLFELSSEGWTVDEASLFCDSALRSFPAEFRCIVYSSFVSSLVKVVRCLPRRILKCPDYIIRHYFETLVELLDCEHIHRELFKVISDSLDDKCPITGISAELSQKWVQLILRCLLHKDTNLVIDGIQPGLNSITQFAPHSYILIPFLLMLFTDQRQEHTSSRFEHGSIASFLTTVFSICIHSDNEFRLPPRFYQTIDSWNQQRLNHELLAQAKSMLEKGNFTLVKNLIVPCLASKSAMLFDDPFVFNTYFNTYITIFLEDLLSSSNALSPNSVQMFSSFSSYLSMFRFPKTIRLFCCLSDYYKKIIKKFPDFDEMYLSCLYSLLHQQKDKQLFNLIFRSALTVVIHSPLHFPVFVLNLQKIRAEYRDGDSKKYLNSLIETIPYYFYRPTPPFVLDEQTICGFCHGPLKAILSVGVTQNNDINFYSRASMISAQFRVTSIEAGKRVFEDPPVLPKTMKDLRKSIRKYKIFEEKERKKALKREKAAKEKLPKSAPTNNVLFITEEIEQFLQNMDTAKSDGDKRKLFSFPPAIGDDIDHGKGKYTVVEEEEEEEEEKESVNDINDSFEDVQNTNDFSQSFQSFFSRFNFPKNDFTSFEGEQITGVEEKKGERNENHGMNREMDEIFDANNPKENNDSFKKEKDYNYLLNTDVKITSTDQKKDLFMSSTTAMLFFAPMTTRNNAKHLLFCPNDAYFFRKFSSLYHMPTREQLKLGVIYVRSDQSDQNTIFNNTESDSSLRFRKFLGSLGECVNLGAHNWYLGKLPPKSDQHSLFFSDAHYEVMFHVSTMLQNDRDDPQKIQKKRHIGNDNVHIVWCENKLGYDPFTITSQFNDAHIIIYPQNVGLYRVVVFKKDEKIDCGPLQNDTLITAGALGALVRLTAITADRFVRKLGENMPLSEYEDLMSQLNQNTINVFNI